MSRVKLKEEFLNLLEKDREFRYAVAGLIGLKEVLKRLGEHDEKLDRVFDRLEEHDKKFNEIVRRLDSHDRKFNEVLKRLDEHDRKFNEIVAEIRGLREDFLRLERRVEVTIGSVGRRWGFDLEKAVLEIFREVLERRGVEPGRVEKFRFRDVDGRVTGVRGRIVDVDVLVKDDRVYVIEVKSRAELDHVELLPGKAKIVEKILKKPIAKTYVVAVNIDREAYERARELGIETIYGNILE